MIRGTFAALPPRPSGLAGRLRLLLHGAKPAGSQVPWLEKVQAWAREPGSSRSLVRGHDAKASSGAALLGIVTLDVSSDRGSLVS